MTATNAPIIPSIAFACACSSSLMIIQTHILLKTTLGIVHRMFVVSNFTCRFKMTLVAKLLNDHAVCSVLLCFDKTLPTSN